MSYSKKDYNYLLLLKEGVSRAKSSFVNSFEVYMNYQLNLMSKYDLKSDDLCKKHYLEWEKVTHLYHSYIIARKNYVRALIDLHLFREYLIKEYSKKDEKK